MAQLNEGPYVSRQTSAPLGSTLRSGVRVRGHSRSGTFLNPDGRLRASRRAADFKGQRVLFIARKRGPRVRREQRCLP